jgi:hypothetical protein
MLRDQAINPARQNDANPSKFYVTAMPEKGQWRCLVMQR